MKITVGLVVVLLLALMLGSGESKEGHKHVVEEKSDILDKLDKIKDIKGLADGKYKGLFADGKSPITMWLEAGSVGRFLDLHETKSLRVDIPVNIMFIGFSGEGNHGFDLRDDVLVDWFEHIEHTIKSVVAPIGEGTLTTEEVRTPDTHIEYSFRIQVSKLDRMVSTLVEDAIIWHLRNEYGNTHHTETEDAPHEDEESVYYTNPYLVSSLLGDLVEHLGLEDSYTVFVMNPSKPVDDGVYGYRTGFSNSELAELYMSEKLVYPGTFSIKTDYDYLNITAGAKRARREEGEELALHINENLKYRDYTIESSRWANKMTETLNKHRHSKSPEGLAECMPDENGDEVECQYQNLLAVESADLIEKANEIFANGTLHDQIYLAFAHQLQLKENCLVDSWISHKRFAFIDLTAGPFTWGPSIGGVGLKTVETLPVVPTPLFHDQDPEDESSSEEPLTPSEVDQEIQVLEVLIDNYCLSNDPEFLENNPVMSKERCAEMIENLNYLKTHKDQTDDSGMRKIDFFTGAANEEIENNDQHNFNAHMGAVLSDSLKHLIVQPLPLFSVKYFHRVNFHVIIITDHKDYDPRDYFHFSYDQFKGEIDKLRVPGQEFSFSIKQISMADDKGLSLAYQASLNTVISPVIDENGVYSTRLNYYIDSNEMKAQLTRLNPDNNDENTQQESKYIPIFIFSLSSTHPIFIDKTLQAKAMSNMVLAVQTNVFSYPSLFSCNGHHSSSYLLNPISSILAATALNLGGLTSSHYAYSEANKALTTSWLWSVGDSPLSRTFTFPVTFFNQFQKDTVQRNYVISSLEKSIFWMNTGAKTLLSIKTNLQNFNSLRYYQVENLTLEFGLIRDQWRVASEHLEKLEFKKAIQTSVQVEKQSYQFYLSALDYSKVCLVSDCDLAGSTTSTQFISTNNPKRAIIFSIVAIIIVFITVIVISSMYKKKSKLKIN